MKLNRNWTGFIALSSIILLSYFESVSAAYDQGDPRGWAIKWNGIGRSKNASDHYAKAWRGKEISTSNKQRLIEKVIGKPAKEVYQELKTRPKPNISPYGTCMVGQKDDFESFWVEGMFGSQGFLGYPKNPETGDGKGHLYSCNTEHRLADLCSYKTTAERVKQTLLLAIQNDVCTDYDKSMLNSIASFDETLNLEKRLKIYLSNVGLSFRSSKGKESQWETLCQVYKSWSFSFSRQKVVPHGCAKTVDGEIVKIRIISNGKGACFYDVTTSGSGILLADEEKIENQYDDAIQAANELDDEDAAESLRIMKKDHLKDLLLAANHDTVKLTTFSSEQTPYSTTSCDLRLEAQIRRFV